MSGPYSTCKLVLDANGAPVIMSGPDQNEDLSLVTATKDVTGGIEIFAAGKNLGLSVNVKHFGAVGDGITDDTVAIQSAVNYCTTTLSGGVAINLHFSQGKYKILEPINIPSSYGFSITGDGRESTQIIQHTNGATILYMSSAGAAYGHRNFVISGLLFSYDQQQTSANNSKAIDCIGFNWVIENCGFSKCYRGIYNLVNSGGRNGGWGIVYDRLNFASMSGASIIYDYQGSGDNGFPNCSISNIYITGSSPTEYGFILRNLSNLNISNVEFNSWGSALMSAQGCNGGINGMRLENPAGQNLINTTNFPQLVSCPASRFLVSGFDATFEVASGTIYIFRAEGASTGSMIKITSILLGSNSATMIPSGGSIVIFKSCPAELFLNLSQASALPSYVSMYDNASTADFNLIDSFPGKGLNVSVGDSDYAVTFVSPEVIRFNSTLTANRSVNLPNLTSEKLINGGQEFIVLRDAVTPGAFTLTLRDSSSAVLATIGSGNKGIIKFRQNRFGWMITSMYNSANF